MRGNGGRIGPKYTPTTGSASGVWSLAEAGDYRRQSLWPPLISSLYSFTNATFTSGSVTEQTGPSLAQARSGLSGTGVDAWKNNTSYFNTINGIQLWVVPETGSYQITAAGARGGGNGGLGAIVRAAYALEAGEIIYILVGQTGNTSSCGGGGGGGTFVARAKNLYGANLVSWAGAGIYMYPLLVGGGGGGQRDTGSSGPQNGSMGTFGTYETGSVASNAGTGGPGGSSPGGGGWSTNGGNGNGGVQNLTDTGRSFVNGGQGGNNNRSPGKFGGGSGATCEICNTAANAGAGGGYSGGGTNSNVGACYTGGGGGGSFIHSTALGTPGYLPATSNGNWGTLSSPHSHYTGAVSNLGSFNSGSGSVIITKI
jgi:hypothetical protein